MKRWLKLSLGILGWLAAALFWYGGRQVVTQADGFARVAGDLQMRLYECGTEKSEAQTALQGCVQRDIPL